MSIVPDFEQMHVIS